MQGRELISKVCYSKLKFGDISIRTRTCIVSQSGCLASFEQDTESGILK